MPVDHLSNSAAQKGFLLVNVLHTVKALLYNFYIWNQFKFSQEKHVEKNILQHEMSNFTHQLEPDKWRQKWLWRHRYSVDETWWIYSPHALLRSSHASGNMWRILGVQSTKSLERSQITACHSESKCARLLDNLPLKMLHAVKTKDLLSKPARNRRSCRFTLL